MGGLHVIGTDRHESRRVDEQLRGRSGRQGDPGSTRFFLSLDDDIFLMFGVTRSITFKSDIVSVEHANSLDIKFYGNNLDQAQRRVEVFYSDIRMHLFTFDRVFDCQRELHYGERRLALITKDFVFLIELLQKSIVIDLFSNCTKVSILDLSNKIVQFFPGLTDLDSTIIKSLSTYDCHYCLIVCSYVYSRVCESYHQKREQVNEVNPFSMMKAEKFFYILNSDRFWRYHLQANKFLVRAVSLKGFSQRHPLTEYKLEGYELFRDMIYNMRRSIVYQINCFSLT